MLRRGRSPARRLANAGFTLAESLVVVAIAGVLSSIAVPGFEAQVQKARRAEAVVLVMHIQSLEERYRANATRYGTLADIGVAPVSASGLYRLQVVSRSADGYELLATATGAQARDTGCAYLRFSVTGLNAVSASGPDMRTANAADANRRCWGS